MSQTLLIEGDDQRGSLLSLNLQVHTGTNVIWKNSIEEAIKVIEVLPEISLVIAIDENSGKVNSLIEFLLESDLDIPTITRKEFGQYGANVSTGNVFDLDKIIKFSSENLGITSSDLNKKIIPDFFPINIENFHFFDESPCDIFIKLKKNKTNARYVKRISAYDSIDYEGLDRYIINGITELYILKQDRFAFTKEFSKVILPLLKEELHGVGVKEMMSRSYSAHDILNQFFGDEVKEEEIELINANINSISEICQKHNSNLKELIDDLLNSSDSFRYQVMIITNYLGVKALKKMHNLGSVSVVNSQIEKFSQACFLHDLLLKSDDLIKVRNQADLDKYEIEEKELVNSHAFKTAEIIKSIKEFDSDVQRIILEHHGKPTGMGFSTEFSNRLHPLTHVLMACEAYAHELLNNLTIKSYDEIIKLLPPIFLKKEFWKVLTNLK